LWDELYKYKVKVEVEVEAKVEGEVEVKAEVEVNRYFYSWLEKLKVFLLFIVSRVTKN
jgi:hypothetical protein